MPTAYQTRKEHNCRAAALPDLIRASSPRTGDSSTHAASAGSLSWHTRVPLAYADNWDSRLPGSQDWPQRGGQGADTERAGKGFRGPLRPKCEVKRARATQPAFLSHSSAVSRASRASNHALPEHRSPVPPASCSPHATLFGAGAQPPFPDPDLPTQPAALAASVPRTCCIIFRIFRSLPHKLAAAPAHETVPP